MKPSINPDCGGGNKKCEHGRQRSRCKDCGEQAQAEVAVRAAAETCEQAQAELGAAVTGEGCG
eukprot:scaffold11042_cov98-Phaeocystis_antarctica.AAC.2